MIETTTIPRGGSFLASLASHSRENLRSTGTICTIPIPSPLSLPPLPRTPSAALASSSVASAASVGTTTSMSPIIAPTPTVNPSVAVPTATTTRKVSRTASTPSAAAATAAAAGVKLNILIADDAALTRKIVERLIINAVATWVSPSSSSVTPRCMGSTSNKSTPLGTQIAGGGSGGGGGAVGSATAANSIATAAQPAVAVAITAGNPSCLPLAAQAPPSRILPHQDSGMTSSSGNGSSRRSVEFNLPDAQKPTIQSSLSHSSSASSASSPSSNTLSTPTNRVVARIDHAANGQLAVDRVVQSMLPWHTPYDVLLIDLYMPLLDGPQAIAEMRDKGYDGIIIAVTGSSAAEDHDRLRAAGASAIMLKPLDVKIFQQILVQHKDKLRLQIG